MDRNLRRRRWIARLCAAAGLVLVLEASAATLVVDPAGGTPYTTIQSAIDAAVPGQDDVSVRCGTYSENLVMRDGIAVRGQSPDCTIIDGRQQGVVVDLQNLGPDTRLEGFTIRNGYDSFGAGAGVRVDGGSPVITRNVIEDNGQLFASSGAGVRVSGQGSSFQASPVISYNVIRRNSGFWGAGVLVYYADGASITANVIVGNAGYYGGGLFVRGYDTTAYVTNNTVIGNTAYLGAGLAIYEASHVVANNVFFDNVALYYGGGVWGWACSGPGFVSNDVFGNLPDEYACDVDPTGTNGNISAHPRFGSQGRPGFYSYQPRSDSPLIDAGSPTWTPLVDLRGIPQAVDGDADGVARTDIGARENEGLSRLIADATGTFVWAHGIHEPERYHVFRGDLDELRTSGLYTQDPSLVPGARHFCDLPPPPFLLDADVPEPNRAFFYLSAAAGTVVGTLGFDGGLDERTPTLPCLGP